MKLMSKRTCTNHGFKVLSVLGFAWFMAACSSSDDGNDGGDNPPLPPSFKTFQEASVVIGQADFAASNPPVTSQISTKNGSGAMAYYQEKGPAPTNGDELVEQLILPVFGENRVLVYDELPDDNQENAAFVIGQDSFTSLVASVGINRFDSPTSVFYSADQDSLWISDSANNRIAVYDNSQLPLIASPTTASFVVGQDDMLSKVAPTCSADSFSSQSAIIADNKLWVVDSNRNRVLVYNTIPSATAKVDADFVAGQPGLLICGNSASASTLDSPTDIWSDGDQLIISDTGNNRVLIWNDLPTTSGEEADVVIGQANFTYNGANQVDNTGAKTLPTASTLNLMRTGQLNFTGLDVSEDGKLCVADSANNRVLIWNEIPTENAQAADIVLGQSDFDKAVQWDDNQDNTPDGVASARTFYHPTGCMFVDDDELVVADYATYRYLIFEEQP